MALFEIRNGSFPQNKSGNPDKNRQEYCNPLFHDMGIPSVENQILFENFKFMHFLKYCRNQCTS